MKKYFYLTILITLLGFVFKDQIGKSLLSKHVDTKKEAIIMVVDVRPKTLDPRFAQDALGMRISDLLYQSLVRVGPKFKIIGDLANKWVIRDNVYTFYLHPNIVFSNGKP